MQQQTYSSYELNKIIRRRLIQKAIKAYNWPCKIATMFIQKVAGHLFADRTTCNNADYENLFLN